MVEGMRLAVIGDPIAHSLSPLLHNTMARELGLPVTYCARRVTVEGLPDWIGEVRRDSWAGFNATMPHKLHLIPQMDRLTEQAVYFGAVNTVKNEGGTLIGHNTDGDGFARMLQEHGLGFSGAHVTILGAGGAAGAIARKALQDGAARITVKNRTAARAEALCAADPAILVPEGLDTPVPPDTELLINTVPAAVLDLTCARQLPGECAVFDILYAPPVTPLMQLARDQGRLAVNGLGMLIHQAILAFAFFTGADFDQFAMAKRLYEAAEKQ